MNNISNIMKVSFITNFLLSLFKVIGGILGKSSALIADGIHSFSDLLTDIIAIFGSGFSNKPADLKHPYGHGKLEYLTSILIGTIVIIIGLTLIGNVSKSEIVIPSFLVIIVSLITIISKYILSRYLIKKGKIYKNNILIASGKESKVDVISSVVVLTSSILMQFSEYVTLFKYTDKIASIIVGIFIIKTGFNIVKENTSVIIGEQETDLEEVESIKKIILNSKFILKIDDLVLLKFGYYYKITADVCMDGNLSLRDAHDEVDKIEKIIKLSNNRAKYITIHINPI